MTPLKDDDFDPKICDVRHYDLDRRVTALESALKENLSRIYEKLDRFGQRPPWFVVVLITALCSGVGVLGMYILTHR